MLLEVMYGAYEHNILMQVYATWVKSGGFFPWISLQGEAQGTKLRHLLDFLLH